LEYTINGSVACINLDGELDHHTIKKANQFLNAVIDSNLLSTLYIDFSRIQFMDSSGLALVFNAYRRMNETAGNLVLKNIPQQPLKVLKAAGVMHLITIE